MLQVCPWCVSLYVCVQKLEEGEVLREAPARNLFGGDGLVHSALPHCLFQHVQVLDTLALRPRTPHQLVERNLSRVHRVDELAERGPVAELLDLALIEAQEVVDPPEELPPPESARRARHFQEFLSPSAVPEVPRSSEGHHWGRPGDI